MKNILVRLLRTYQRWLSPLFGMRCRFHPSCSEYAIGCLKKHTTHKACWLIAKRLVRCQPLNPGGFDPVP